MIRKILGLGVCFLAMSCSVEKVNLSPATSLLSTTKNDASIQNISKDIHYNADFIKYSSEITNTLSTHTDFENKDVNKTFSDLKFYVEEYIYTIKEHNTVGREKAFYNYEILYKKIQKQKNKLSPEKEEILNRILIKIKTNLNLIEALDNNTH